MFRVFDSLTFEDEHSDKMQYGYDAKGEMDAKQTKDFMWLVFNTVNRKLKILLPLKKTAINFHCATEAFDDAGCEILPTSFGLHGWDGSCYLCSTARN